MTDVALPLPVGIASVTPGPGSTVRTSTPHGVKTGDKVAIVGSGDPNVDSSTSGGWQRAPIADISPGPSSIVTLATPTTIPPDVDIMVQDAAAPAAAPTVPPSPPGVTILGVTAGPGSIVETTAPHGFEVGDPCIIWGVNGMDGVNSPSAPSPAPPIPGPPIPSRVKSIVDDTHFVTANGPTAGAYPPVGVAIVGVSSGPGSLVSTTTPGHGLRVGQHVAIDGVAGITGVNAFWTVTGVFGDFEFQISNGVTSGAYSSGGTSTALPLVGAKAFTLMQGLRGPYAPGTWKQLSPTTLRLPNGLTWGSSHPGALVTWFEPLVLKPWKIVVTGPSTFTIPNGPSGPASGGSASDYGP